MRLHRLRADWESIQRLVEESRFIEIGQRMGSPPEKYLVTFHCKGLMRAAGAVQPSISSSHQVEIYLHQQYPRIQPRLTWRTAIFHPNILSGDRNGGVCIGGWSAAETLADLCVRLAEMVQYKRYNPRDPLDPEAAEWAVEHFLDLPIDERPIIGAAANRANCEA